MDGVGFILGVVSIVGLGAAHGGYFPTAWGWPVVVFGATFAWSLSVGAVRSPSALENVFLGALFAFVCWYAFSSLWGTASAAIEESVRGLVYVAGAAAAVIIVRRGTAPALLAGVLTGTSALACYALASRLFPDRIGTFDSVAGYRLSTPIGYWNALGLLCALAVLLAVGLAASTSSPARAAFAAAPVPILLATLYFTFSRGSWIALGIGLVAATALDPRRVRLTATALTAGVPAGLGVLAGSRSVPLTHLQSTVARAAHDGHRLALLLLAFVVAAAALTAALVLLRSVMSIPPVVSRTYPIALLAAAVVAIAVAVVHVGGPGVAAATGAYVAYLAGAAVDWDWEITSVTLAAIFVGVALLASVRPDDEREASPALRYGTLGVAPAVGAAGFVFLIGNMFLSRASSAASGGHWTTAARDARRASSWLPWSTAPWQQLGEAQLAQGQTGAAQTSFRKVIGKDSGDWNLWLDLARASAGKTQVSALAHATRLNPRSPEIAALRSELGAQAGISITASKATP